MHIHRPNDLQQRRPVRFVIAQPKAKVRGAGCRCRRRPGEQRRIVSRLTSASVGAGDATLRVALRTVRGDRRPERRLLRRPADKLRHSSSGRVVPVPLANDSIHVELRTPPWPCSVLRVFSRQELRPDL